jgi:hypothetical protein
MQPSGSPATTWPAIPARVNESVTRIVSPPSRAEAKISPCTAIAILRPSGERAISVNCVSVRCCGSGDPGTPSRVIGTACASPVFVSSLYRSAVPTAMAVWNYLFGEPAPTWYVWNQSTGSYEFKPR